jgi:hypothetical protein
MPCQTVVLRPQAYTGTQRDNQQSTTEELLDLAEDVMRKDREFLKDFNVAVDALLLGRALACTTHPSPESRIVRYGEKKEKMPYEEFRKLFEQRPEPERWQRIRLGGGLYALLPCC